MGLSNVMTVSLSKKMISGSSFLGIFTGRSCEMTLFISLSWASFRDFSILLAVNPPKIVFISSIGGLLSPASWSLSLSSFHWYLWGSFFWHTSVTSFAGLKSPPSPSNIYTHWCDACGTGRTCSTCSYLFVLLEYWLALAIVERDHPLSASIFTQSALLEE